MHGNQTFDFHYSCPMITKYCVVGVTDDDGRNKITLRNCAVSEVCENRGWTNPEETAANIEVVEGIGNIGSGSFLVPETDGREIATNGCSYNISFNNLYDLEGNLVYKGRNVQKPSNGIESVGADPKFPANSMT